MITRKLKATLTATAILGIAVATGDDDATDEPIRGDALDSVTETEAGDEESHHEVEVTRADGIQVDVQLDRGFKVVGSADDGDGAGDDS